MDRQREYNAILEQVTREASLQAELDLRARAQAEAGRNFPTNILNRLDIQARLGSRVAPIEEPTHQLHSRLGCGPSGLRQQLSIRNQQSLLQPYPAHCDVTDQPAAELSYSGYNRSQLLTRLPLMGNDPRMHNFRSSMRNHSPVQHGSFADDIYPQESFQSQVDCPIRPLMSHSTETQQRMVPEIQQERRTLSQGGSLYQKSTRPLIRPPISQKNQPSVASKLPGNLRNASTRSPNSSPVSSTNRNVISGSELNRKKVFLQARDNLKLGHSSKTPIKIDNKSTTISPKAPSIAAKITAVAAETSPLAARTPPLAAKTIAVIAKSSIGGKVENQSPVEPKLKIKTVLPSEKKLPSLFGPPPSAPALTYKDADQDRNSSKSIAVTSKEDNAVEIVESLPPKPLMDLTPSLTALPFSNTLFSESNLQPVKKDKSSSLQVGPVIPPGGILDTGKPVPLLDIEPVPLFNIEPVSFGTDNTSQSLNPKTKSPLPIKPSADELKLLEVNSKCLTTEEENSLHSSSNEKVKEKSSEQKEATNLLLSSHTVEIIGDEESHDDVARPLWYTNPDSLCQSVDTTDSLTGDIEQNGSSNEVEEGEIIGESLSDEKEIIETKHHKAVDVVVVTSEVTGESSSSILKRFYATPEEFIHFLPFPAEASEDNVKSIEKCWQQLLILHSFSRKQKRACSQKILSRIKSHFAQERIKPTGNLIQFSFKLWSHIATYLGAYLQQRLDGIVRGLVHRSMIDFILIHMHKKKMPRSLKNISIKAQINLLYIFSMQGFTNATNNYMVKWLQDELEKVGTKLSGNPSNSSPARLDVRPAKASAHLNSLVLSDQLMEKKFCLVEYLKVKCFSDPKEEEQCVRICTSLKCQDYIPNAEWTYDKGKVDKADEPPDSLKSEPKGLPTIDITKDKEIKPISDVSDKMGKKVVPKSQAVDTVPGDKAGLQKMASQTDGIKADCEKIDVPLALFGSEEHVQDDLRHSDAVSMENKAAEIQKTEAAKSSAGGTEKTVNNDITKTGDCDKENVSITIISELEATPAEKTCEVSSNNNSIEKHRPLIINDAAYSKKRGGHSRKFHTDTAGKWHSYMAEGNSSGSRIASKKRKHEMVHHRRHSGRSRAHSSSIVRNRLSNKSSGSERSQHSDGNNAVDSDSDSEDLEMMQLRKKALLSMLKGSMAKKSGDNNDPKSKGNQQADLDASTEMLALEQISDTEGHASPVAYSIAESGVVLVSLGPDNVVSFPSQYNAVGSVDEAGSKPEKAEGDNQKPVEKKIDIADEKMENSTVAIVTPGLKPSEETSRPLNEAVAAYYKVSTGGNDQKQADKGKQSFVIHVTSEDSDSDETDIDKTAPHSTVTSGTSSPMPVQQDNSSTPSRKDLEELIQHYKKRAKEKEVVPLKSDQGSLKSPDAIKIMPQPKQDEYRSLKEQIAQLEKKKQERKTANKRKATVPPTNQAKRFKPDSTCKDNVQQQAEVLASKKQSEYQTNIAVCEVQLEELKITIDRDYSDVMRLNKQLNDCASEIEEHTMKLQLLNKQLKIAKDARDLAQAKQQEIKNKVKLAQNSLLKKKNAMTAVEGELTHFRSLLAKLISEQKFTQPKHNQSITSNDDGSVKQNKLCVVDTIVASNDHATSSADHQTQVTSDNVTVNMPKSTDVASRTKNISSESTTSPLSFSKRLTSKVTRETKIKPGQKIANVVKKLSQEHLIHASSAVASGSEEVANQSEDKNTRRSLDAVVAKLHIVKKQEFDKQFHVDLGSAKQARENTKLDSVVEKLVAKQSQSQLLSSGWPLHFETLVNKTATVNTVVNSSMHCMDADVSSTVPDNFDDSKMNTETKSVKTEASMVKGKFQSTPTDKPVTLVTDKPVITVRIADSKQENAGELVTDTVTKQAVQTKLTSRPKSTLPKTEPAQALDSEVKFNVTQLMRKEQTDATDGNSFYSLASLPTRLTGLPITSFMLSSRSKQILSEVQKFVIETFSIKPKNLESLLGKDDSREMLSDSMCGSLTDYYIENLQVYVQQDSSVPDAIFVNQPAQELSAVSSSAVSSFNIYKSPLSCFKSYRLHPYYRTRAKLAVSSSTYSNKISPHMIMCRFNMTGRCSDKGCKWQHWSETQMNSNELFSDIVSYAPDLAMVTNDDDVSTAQSKISAHIGNVVNSFGKKMTTDQIGVYLVDQVVNNCDNRTFNARIEGKIPVKSLPDAESSASIQRPKSFTSDFKAVFDTTYSQLGTLGQLPIKNSTQKSDRYFDQCEQGSSEVDSSCDPKAVVLSVRESLSQNQNEDTENVHKCAITLLEGALRTNPQEEVLWIELLRIHAKSFVKLPVDQMTFNLFQGLCNRAIKATDSYNIFQECISLLPTHEMKIKWYIKGYNMVKLKVNEKEKSLQCLELFLGSVVLDYMTGYTVEGIEKMKFSLHLKECQGHYPFKDLLDHLTCDDLLLFWMVYIYYCHSHAFPACVIETTASGCRILEKKTFMIHWKEGERLNALYSNFIQLFKMALKHCKSVYTVKYPNHTSAVYALQFQNLFENLILLEYKCGNLEAAKVSIRKVLSVQPSYLGMWLLLADVVVKCGYTEGYKEVFVEAENKLRGNVEFYYIVAKKISQQGDRDEAMRWLTSCVHSKYTGKFLNITEYAVILHYRKLLRQPVPYHFQTSTVVPEFNTQDIPHLWLCYCLYMELVGVSKVVSEHWPSAEDAYEAAVHSVHSPNGIKLVWKAYLTHLRSSAISKDAELSNWKQFLDGINRAFQVVDPKDDKFQIEVVDMCITALPETHDDKALGLYNHWIKMFPYNKALVCRCSDAAIKLNHIEMAQNVLATYLTSHPEDWNVWKKAIEIEMKLNNVKEVRWMYWEASKSSLFNIFFWKEFLKFELQQCIVSEDTHQVTTVLQQCRHLGINLTKLVS